VRTRPWILLSAILCVLSGARNVLAAPGHGAKGSRRAATTSAGAERQRVASRPAGALEGAHKPTLAKPRGPERADSVGHPNEGHLEGGAHLDTRLPYVRVVPAYESGDVRWGLPSLVHMLERAARVVAKKYPGSVLDVGDISRKGGGDVLRHHSHESGRDADVGFYAVDAKGKQVHAPAFIKFDRGLVSSNVPGARFDLPRTWLLVQTLLTDPVARTSHIFIAEPLRHELLGYAKARGVSRALLDHAAVVMMQPTNSLAHDDHMHVRVSCPHAAHSTCIELAKNAPLGHLAHREPRGVHRAARGAHHGAPTLRSTPTARAAAVTPPRASTGAKDAKPPAALMNVASQRPDDEGEADAAEVKDALDDVGLLRITE
jgi:penicillin-insensitive murein endopeptidase